MIWVEKMIERDPAGEPGDDRERDELIAPPNRASPNPTSMTPAHRGRDHEPVDPVALDDAVDDDDKGPGRTADLNTGPAERGDEEPGDDGGVEAPIGGHATGDRECDGQRKRDDAHDEAGRHIGRELRPRIPPQRGHQLRYEHAFPQRLPWPRSCQS